MSELDVVSVPKTAGEPAASVVIPSYRGAARLPALLDSLAAQEEGTPDFEVIVVIDGVDDGSAAVVDAENRIAVRSVEFPENRGRVAALNAGFDDARGRVLIRCDDDLVVPPTFVSAHVSAHQGPAVGVIGLTRDIHRDSAYARAYGTDAGDRAHRAARNLTAEERWRLWAANCSITRDTWEQVGPYDTRYRAYGWEDVDYGYRLAEAGLDLVIADAAEAKHHGPARTAASRAHKAFESGAARAMFRQLHPGALLPAAGPGKGIWGKAVGIASHVLSTGDRVRRVAGIVDQVLPLVPNAVGRKLVALAVEGAALGAESSRGAATEPTSGRTAATRRTAAAGRPRVAIAHDYLTQRGGAERLVLSILKAFPDAEIHTLFYEPDQTYPEYRDARIRTSPLNRIGVLRRDPRKALPLLAPFASRMRIDADVVVASSSGWAHAFPTTGKKIVYCHSPARWLYLPEDYLGDAGRFDVKRLALTVLTPLLKPWDRRAALRADRYFGNSSVVVERIRRVYGIHPDPLFPPFSPAVAEGDQEPIGELADWVGAGGEEGGHYLVVSRLQPYKHVDRVIEAFRELPGKRLLIIGKGPERDRLRAMAPSNVRLVEGLTDAQMRWAYAHCAALIAASHEDFGLTPLEACAHGKPVIALRAGGYLDTVREGVNGVFFDAPEAGAIRTGIAELDNGAPWDERAIRAHADRFSEEQFIAALHDASDEALRYRQGPQRTASEKGETTS